MVDVPVPVPVPEQYRPATDLVDAPVGNECTPENADHLTSYAEIAGLMDRMGNLEQYS
jgi:hypothetical protein